MKTAEEKVNDFLRKYVGEFTNAQEGALILMLKEQDRDTRHACAEAVIGCDPNHLAPKIIDDCHAACMNVKAV